jgi:hypothetical protein
MYPFKLAIEQLRLASVQWSPSREAGERTRVANERLSEVRQLYRLEIYNQLPTAIRALNQAVVEAQKAVAEARKEGELVSRVVDQLNRVMSIGAQVVKTVAITAEQGAVGLSGATAKEIQAAVQQSPAVKPPTDPATPPTSGGTGTPPQTSAPPAGQGPGSTTPPTQSTSPPTTNPPEPSTSQAPPPSTEPPTTAEPPTTPTPPSTQPDPSVTVGSIGVDTGGLPDQAGSSDQAGPSEEASRGYAPPTTTPPTTAP